MINKSATRGTFPLLQDLSPVLVALLFLLDFCVAVDLDAEEVAIFVPIHLDVGDVEDILALLLIPRRNVQQRHASGDVTRLRHLTTGWWGCKKEEGNGETKRKGGQEEKEK